MGNIGSNDQIQSNSTIPGYNQAEVRYRWLGVPHLKSSRSRQYWFEPKGQFTNRNARAAAEGIINEITNQSGLTRKKGVSTKTKNVLITITVTLLITIALTVYLSILSAQSKEWYAKQPQPKPGDRTKRVSPQAAMIGILAMLLCCTMCCGSIISIIFCVKVDASEAQSNTNEIERFCYDNSPKWESTMAQFGYSIDWEVVENALSYRRKVSGRHRVMYRRYPTAWVCFFNSLGRNNSERVRAQQAQRQQNGIPQYNFAGQQNVNNYAYQHQPVPVQQQQLYNQGGYQPQPPHQGYQPQPQTHSQQQYQHPIQQQAPHTGEGYAKAPGI